MAKTVADGADCRKLAVKASEARRVTSPGCLRLVQMVLTDARYPEDVHGLPVALTSSNLCNLNSRREGHTLPGPRQLIESCTAAAYLWGGSMQVIKQAAAYTHRFSNQEVLGAYCHAPHCNVEAV